MSPYTPPRNLVEVMGRLDLSKGLEPGDPRYVDTAAARGDEGIFKRLAVKFGYALSEHRVVYAPPAHHQLFFGHVGSGKSTELARYAKRLSETGWFVVVDVNINLLLDKNNLQYADTLIAMAHQLLEVCREQGVALRPDALAPLDRWHSEHITTFSKGHELVAEAKAGLSVDVGLPFLSKLLGGLVTTFRTNRTYKEELRTVVRNSFTDFVAAFNALVRAAEDGLAEHREPRPRLLFVLDGTDKLDAADTRRFFIDDAEQLAAAQTYVIYTAPISMKYENNLEQKLDSDLVLPMIKLLDRSGAPHGPGQTTMREILLRRIDRAAFESETEVEALVNASGGHPRELLRLLKLACEFGDDVIDGRAVAKAIQSLASNYRRFLEPEDYAMLAQLDTDPLHVGNDARVRKLLLNLALLEYNDGSWRRSHPVVRTLEGYSAARAKLAATSA